MNKIFFTSCLILFSLDINAQIQNSLAFMNGTYDTDYIKTNQIKSATETAYINDNNESVITFYFNRNGNLQSYVRLKDKKMISKSSYAYYGSDTIICIIENYEMRKTFIDTTIKVYEKGILQQLYSSNINFLYKYVYSNNGLLSHRIVYLSKDTTHAYKVIENFFYDEMNRITSSKNSQFNGSSKISYSQHFIYNKRNQIIQKIISNYSIYNLTYNEKNLLESEEHVMKAEYEDEKDIRTFSKYTYEFY